MSASTGYSQEGCQARAHVGGEARYRSGNAPLLVLEGVRPGAEEIVFQMHSVRIGETPREKDGQFAVKVRVHRRDFLPGATSGQLVPQARAPKPILELGPFVFPDTYENRFIHRYLHKEVTLPMSALLPRDGMRAGFQVEISELLSDGSERLLDVSLQYLVLPFAAGDTCASSTPADSMVFAGESFDFSVQEEKEGQTFSASFNILLSPKAQEHHHHH